MSESGRRTRTPRHPLARPSTTACAAWSAATPNEPNRTATPLELLFDLTFVVAFSQAGAQTAHLLELGHWAPAIIGFLFAVFAIWWAWINYSWLASAYDNDDIFFRVATMVEMLGVLILALGLPALFHSLDEGEHVDNGVVVAGYVVMRVATIALWLRAAKHDTARRRTALTYVVFVSITQLGWIVLIFVNLPLAPTLAFTAALIVLELVGPYVAEHGREGGTPWHAHHIAERYGLLVIITLGEIILGTILAISAVIDEQDWSVETVAVAFGGTALAFGLWWVYFTMPSGKVLAAVTGERGFVWGYLHYFIFVALAGAGAGPARGRVRDRGRRPHRHRAGAPDRRRPRRRSSWSRCSRSTRCCCGSSTRSTSGCSSAASSCSCSRWSPSRPARPSGSAS